MTYEELGRQLITNAEHELSPLPFKLWTDFPLYFTIEFEVMKFEEEVGFWAAVFGVKFLSLNSDYAILTDEKRTFTFSIKRNAAEPAWSGVKIQWFTDDLDQVLSVLSERGVGYQIHDNSEHQRFARFSSPNGLVAEVWSGWEGE